MYISYLVEMLTCFSARKPHICQVIISVPTEQLKADVAEQRYVLTSDWPIRMLASFHRHNLLSRNFRANRSPFSNRFWALDQGHWVLGHWVVTSDRG